MDTLFQHSYFPSIKALKFASKATFSALLSIYIAFLLDLDQPYWSAMTALIVAQPQAGMVLSKGLARLVGTLVGTVLSVIIMGTLSQVPLLFLSIIAIILTASVAFASIIRSAWSYAFVMIGITVTIILVPNIGSPVSIFDYASSRCIESCIGIVVSSIVFAIIWPINTHDLLIQDADQTIHLGFSTAIKSMKGEEFNDTFLQSLSNIMAVDAQREHAAFEGHKGQNSADAILGMCQHILSILSLARSIYRDKKALSSQDWAIVTPWIDATIEALEHGRRANINVVLKSLDEYIADENILYSQAVNITLHRIQLLLKHALRARRFLHSARKGLPIKLMNEHSLSQHRNYTLGLLFGCRASLAFILTIVLWFVCGWSLQQAIIPLAISAIICSLFANRENAQAVVQTYFYGSIYAVISGLIICIYILPYASNVWMLFLVMSAPVFVFSMIALSPKYSCYSALPIVFFMFMQPDNYVRESAEFLLNKSVGLLIGTGIATLAIHLITIDVPYWHGKIMKNLILKDLIRLIYRPLNNSDTWFNARMADRLILLAKHKDVIEKHTKYSWQNAIIALDLGDEIFFLRSMLKHYPELNVEASIYFESVTRVLKDQPKKCGFEILESATQRLNRQIALIENPKKAMTLQSATRQLQKIWSNWCQLNEKERKNGNSRNFNR